jgi:uncharacterized membrane protein YgcG
MSLAAKISRAAAATAMVAGALLFATSAPASAAASESITAYASDFVVQANGTVDVTEAITYDFGGENKHGIIREIPVSFHFNKSKDRIYRISNVTVRRDGAAEPFTSTDKGGFETFKIGDARKTITGAHKYVITYSVAGALNAFKDHIELYWNAVGTLWTVPIEDASATVEGPADILRVACFFGPQGSSDGCQTSQASGKRAEFAESALGDQSGMTVVVSFPPGSIANTDKILVQRRDLAAAFWPSPISLGGAGVLGVLGIVFATFIGWVVGRDRAYAGFLPGLTPGYGQTAEEKRKPVFGKPPVSVEFVPPDGVRPGQVGTLVDEQADSVDVVATIIDFAVRKHLRIRELSGANGKVNDWELVKLDDGDPKFLGYERELFYALFRGREQVRISELRNTFATDFNSTKTKLYADMVTQGWYRQSPYTTRIRARRWGALALVASAGVTAILAIFTHVALIGLGLIIGSIALLVASNKFPARTGKGSAALARVQGFRLYIATAEATQIKWEEREQIFSRYLPYAMVFGLAERWAKIFGDLGTVGPDGRPGLYWYSGYPGWNMFFFTQSIGSFTTTTASSITSTPPSASGSSGFSGGFSGGGGGGGGGGSW